MTTGPTTDRRGGAQTVNDAETPGGGATGGTSRRSSSRHGHGAPVTESADEEGLRAAFLAHSGELYGYARRSLSDAGAAEEVVQETFIRAWRARERFDPDLGSLRTWLFAIERRIVIDHARSRALRQTSPLPADLVQVGDDIEKALVGWQVEEALRRLRPEHRQVLVETYYRGRAGREVAMELGIPEGTVRSRLFYALQSLRLTLDEMGWDQ
ncbi:MAG TPA: sigma-70 family RNA polymerase sigma factor [Acidimicrobiales bacterium]|nr:sigma-70 family RNA polymerase sigma factor [Acidimicrobiales bacterium]